MEDAEKLIGTPADGPAVPAGIQLKKTYRWNGVFRKYRLVAYYTQGKPAGLVKVE